MAAPFRGPGTIGGPPALCAELRPHAWGLRGGWFRAAFLPPALSTAVGALQPCLRPSASKKRAVQNKAHPQGSQHCTRMGGSCGFWLLRRLWAAGKHAAGQGRRQLPSAPSAPYKAKKENKCRILRCHQESRELIWAGLAEAGARFLPADLRSDSDTPPPALPWGVSLQDRARCTASGRCEPGHEGSGGPSLCQQQRAFCGPGACHVLLSVCLPMGWEEPCVSYRCTHLCSCSFHLCSSKRRASCACKCAGCRGLSSLALCSLHLHLLSAACGEAVLFSFFF